MSRASFIRSLQGFPRIAMRPTIASMVRVVSGATGIAVDAIASKARDLPTAHARQNVFAIARLDDLYRETEVARYFDVHPTTVRHGNNAFLSRKL